MSGTRCPECGGRRLRVLVPGPPAAADLRPAFDRAVAGGDLRIDPAVTAPTWECSRCGARQPTD